MPAEERARREAEEKARQEAEEKAEKERKKREAEEKAAAARELGLFLMQVEPPPRRPILSYTVMRTCMGGRMHVCSTIVASAPLLRMDQKSVVQATIDQTLSPRQRMLPPPSCSTIVYLCLSLPPPTRAACR